jgi:hypothetical protein
MGVTLPVLALFLWVDFYSLKVGAVFYSTGSCMTEPAE